MLQTFDQRIRAKSAATLLWLPVDQDGTATSAGGTVTVDITTGDGSALVTAGSTGTSGSYVTYSLSAANNSTLNWLTVNWKVSGTTVDTTVVEVVGDYYASILDIRNSNPKLKADSYPDDRVLASRWEAEKEAERVSNCSFVPRYHRERLNGSGCQELQLSNPMLRSVRSVRVYSDATNYTAFTAAELAAIPQDDMGYAIRTDYGYFPAGLGNIVIEYEHGFDRPPADLLRLWYRRVLWFADTEKRAVQSDEVSFYQVPDGTQVTLSNPMNGSYFAKLYAYGEAVRPRVA